MPVQTEREARRSLRLLSGRTLEVPLQARRDSGVFSDRRASCVRLKKNTMISQLLETLLSGQ